MLNVKAFKELNWRYVLLVSVIVTLLFGVFDMRPLLYERHIDLSGPDKDCICECASDEGPDSDLPAGLAPVKVVYTYDCIGGDCTVLENKLTGERKVHSGGPIGKEGDEFSYKW